MLKLSDKMLKKIKWGTLIVCVSILFLTCLYDDLLTTYMHSLHFLDCVFSGNFLEFYEYTLSRTVFELPADYYVLIYIIFGIWSFPIWILRKFVEFDSFVVPAVLWMKLILLPFVAGVLSIVHRMIKLLEENESEHTLFMICSSLMFVLPICFMGQYDVISLFFILCGIYLCMKEQKVSWKAVALFSVAIPIKILAIFPVVLIILIQEKKVIEIVKKVLGSLIGMAICVIPFVRDSAFHEALNSNGGWFERISAEVIPSGWNGISIFWCIFFGLCIVAYRMKQSNLKEYFKQFTWILTAFYALFFIFVPAHPQWSVLLVPFMSLMIREENADFMINAILDTIAGVALILSQAYYFDWVYFTDRTSWLLLDWITNKGNRMWLVSLGSIGTMEKLITLINAAYFTAVIGLLFMNHPWKKKTELQVENVIEIRTAKVGIAALRILAIFGYIVITALITYVL